MPQNRGKAFEKLIRDQIKQLPNTACERLNDGMSGYINSSRNPSDFIVYKKPYMYYVECKSIHGASIPIQNFKQIDLMAERCTVDGVFGKFIVWFVTHQKTFWIDYKVVLGMQRMGYKSINYNKLTDCAGVQEIPAVYKRVYGVYDFSKLIGGEL